MRQIFAILVFISTATCSYSQNQIKLHGNLTTDQGDQLSYGTVYIKELGTGAVSNDVGYYEVQLKPGIYYLVFQFLGYESKEMKVEIIDEDVQLDVSLKPEAVILKNITISGVDEDPAYAIMRKAIAKAKYHTQQIDSFSANVYLKGKGRLIDSPFFIRRQLKKEGIDSTRLYVSETYSEIKYKRPATYSERVISVRSTGPDGSVEPMEFISGSFYEPKIGEVVSPLSPKSFAYYRFEYLGTTKDKEYQISKIKVIPRVAGENVVSGILYIVEDYFSIHSLKFRTVVLGIDVDIEQIYQPIERNVWLPVSHQFYIKGKFWGFMFEFNYLATVSNYQVTLNPDLPHEIEVLDEKTEKELVDNLNELAETRKEVAIQNKLVEGQEVSSEDLKSILKTYEKEERKKLEEPLVVYNKDFTVDSLATKYDSTYWVELRPIPLNDEEVKGYHWLDSLAEVNRKKAEGDTLSRKDKKGFSPIHIITGARYKVGDKAHLELARLKGEFNTVEGILLETELDFTKVFEKLRYFKTYGIGRYGFSGNDFYYRLGLQYDYGPRLKRGSIQLSGGNYVFQFNDKNPIHPTVNSFTTLFLEQNFMKLYEKEFAKIQFEKNLAKKLKMTTSLEYSRRKPLENTSDYTLIDIKNRGYSSNFPESAELTNTQFDPHNALLFNLGFHYKPGLRYAQRNDDFYELKNKVPKLFLNYRWGLDMFDGDAVFQHLNLNAMHEFIIARNAFKLSVDGGVFLSDAPKYFIDHQHFMGNQSPFLPSKSLASYRLLNYYRHSTSDKYFSFFSEYHPSKLLLTQVRGVRRWGMREYLVGNYLASPTSENYFELGIGFDNLFKFMKIETITSFRDGGFREFGVKIGIASFLNFGDNQVSVQF